MSEKEKELKMTITNPYRDLEKAIDGSFDPYKIKSLLREAFHLILDSENSMEYPYEFISSIWWKLAERNIIIKVLENAMKRTTGISEIFTRNRLEMDIIGDVSGDDYEAHEFPKYVEKELLQEILRRDDDSVISWEEIEKYELILSARARNP